MLSSIMKYINSLAKIFALALFANPALASDEISKPNKEISQSQKNAECLGLAEIKPEKAIDYAIDWRARFGGLNADHCLAIAYINSGNYSEGAKKLMIIAGAAETHDLSFKAKTLSKAANAYLLADMPDEALEAINLAIEIEKNSPNFLMDRARVFAMLTKWSDAEVDLTSAMKIGGEIGFALRLRAEAQMQLGKNDLALKDIERALELEPKAVDNYIVRGRIREAIRLGHPPE